VMRSLEDLDRCEETDSRSASVSGSERVGALVGAERGCWRSLEDLKEEVESTGVEEGLDALEWAENTFNVESVDVDVDSRAEAYMLLPGCVEPG
jgi:hypothetical protein